jgi:biopolymer transport protein ExbD
MSDFQIAPRKSVDDSMIPMINIVFLLLIFFMVAGHIEAASDVDVQLPVSEQGGEAGVTSKEVSTVKLTLNGESNLTVDSQPLSLESLKIHLSQLNPEQTSISISADRGLSAANLDAVLAVIREHKFQTVALQVLQDSPQ